MDTETQNSNLASNKIISRKNFLLAATGVAAYLGTRQNAGATGTQAYLDSVETFTANQTFGSIPSPGTTINPYAVTGNAYFESGYPWVDVKAYGAVGNGVIDDTVAINTAISHAITSTLGTDATGNAMVYFPPGSYPISGSIAPPNSASNYALIGAGPFSSVLMWKGLVNPAPSMLKLVNARGVTIRGLGFYGSHWFPPAYGIEINRGAGKTGTAYPTDIVVENCFLGSPAPSSIGTAIGYTADSATCDDVPSGFGTFRDVYIAQASTAYHFGTTQAYGNNIIAGDISSSSVAAIDNTAAPYKVTGISPYGGSYTLYGLRTSGNAVLFNVGQSNGYSVNVFSLQGESDNQFINTPADVHAQTLQFFGGLITTAAPSPNTILFNSTGGQLEFRGFQCVTSSGQGVWNFPGSAAVALYGGAMGSQQWLFNGPLQLHGMEETNQDVGSAFTNLGGGILQEYNHDGRLVGSVAGINGNMSHTSPGTAAGSGAMVTVTGTDMAGVITLTVGSGMTAGTLVTVNYATVFPSSTASVVLILPAEPNSAAAITKAYVSANTASSFTLAATAALTSTAGTIYQWSYVVMG